MLMEEGSDQGERQPSFALASYAAFSLLSFAAIGAGLIVLAWVATEVQSATLVGQLFFVGSLVSICFSILGGAVVDRRSRRSVIRRGQLIRLCGACALILGLSHEQWIVAALFAFATLNSIGMALNAGAVDGVLQGLVSASRMTTVVMRISVLRQIGLALGTSVTGFALHLFGSQFCAVAIAAILIIQLVLAEVFTRGFSAKPVLHKKGFATLWVEGLGYVGSHRMLLHAILGVALLFSVSQMTNVLVPSFVRDVLKSGSDVYGVLETAWSVSGGSLLALAAVRQRTSTDPGRGFVLLAGLGVLMIVFSFSRSLPLVIALYALMGALFSLARAFCDAQILTLTDPEQIGRVRAVTSICTSCFGMLIYIFPTFIQADNITIYYQAWGMIILTIGGVLSWMQTQSRRSLMAD